MFSSLALSVCCIVPFMFSHMLLPFVITPGLLPPLSSPVPCLFISVCVFSLYIPFTPCPVILFVSPSAPAHVPAPISAPVSVPVCSQFPVPFGMCFWIFAFCILIWTLALICALPFWVALCLAVFCCYFAFRPVLSVFDFFVFSFNLLMLTFRSPLYCLLSSDYLHLGPPPFHSLPL